MASIPSDSCAILLRSEPGKAGMEPIEGQSIDELLQAQTQVWTHTFHYISSMSLKCAVELGIPDAIHRHGQPITLTELLNYLSIPHTKAPYLKRLMRVLVNSGLFATQSKGTNEEDEYLLTTSSRLLVKDNKASLSPFLLAMLQPVLVTPFHSLSAWLRGDEPSAFVAVHGRSFWDELVRNAEFNRMFNDGMAGDSSFSMELLLREHGGMFQGLKSLVDVGGGTGSTAKAIARAFPEIKCTVLELPHVVADAKLSEDGTVEFIAGDMFDSIPQADAVLLKWILHAWSDNDCVKILQQCKKAISCREAKGKVIIIDIVVGAKGSHQSGEAQLYFDMLMMMVNAGIEREEHQWQKIFTDAGIEEYKITSFGPRSVIKVYP